MIIGIGSCWEIPHSQRIAKGITHIVGEEMKRLIISNQETQVKY